jgi:threonine dehydratase
MTKNKEEHQEFIPLDNIHKAARALRGVAEITPLTLNTNLSTRYDCKIWLKREDLQVVRSYKIRGAYNMMSMLTKAELQNGVVCASAGNHAQGVAYACQKMKIEGKIYMPTTTPKQKVKNVEHFGKNFVKIVLIGDTYDAAYAEAIKDATENNKTFIPAFDDERVMAGQGTVGLEIDNANYTEPSIDYIFLAVGGGGLAAGLGSFFKQVSPKTKIIGVEPSGAAAMHKSLKQGKVIILDKIDPFVDGAAVRKVGDKTFAICKKVFDEDIVLVPEGKVCSTILQLYNEEAMVVEPAGALSIAALDKYKDKIKGKNVVCVVSGGNNDITRMEEIKERSLLHEGLKHYFILHFPQRSGSLREFLNCVLSETDDITHFSYTKKHNRESGPAVVGIELKKKEDYHPLIARMKERGVEYEYLNENPTLLNMLI